MEQKLLTPSFMSFMSDMYYDEMLISICTPAPQENKQNKLIQNLLYIKKIENRKLNKKTIPLFDSIQHIFHIYIYIFFLYFYK